MSSKIFHPPTIPMLYANPVNQQDYSNQRIFHTHKILDHIKNQEEMNCSISERFQEIECLLSELFMKHQQFRNEVCHHMTNQVSLNDWIMKLMNKQEEKCESLIEEQLKQTETNKSLQADIHYTRDQQAQYSTLIHDLNEQTKQLKKNLANKDQSLLDLSNQLKQQKEFLERLNKGIDKEEVLAVISDHLKQNEKLENQLQENERKYEELFEQFNELTKVNDHLGTHMNDHDDLYAELTKQINEQRERNEKLEKTIKHHEQIHADLSSKINKHQNVHQELAIQGDEHTHQYLDLIKKLNEQVELNKELRKELSTECEPQTNNKGPFVQIFRTLPPNYPVQSVLISGTSIQVTRFLNMNKENDLAHFTDEVHVKSFDCNKIDGVKWGEDPSENDYLQC